MAREAVPITLAPLCLPAATGQLPEGGVVISSAAAPRRREIEHAGHSYQDKLRVSNGGDARDIGGKGEDGVRKKTKKIGGGGGNDRTSSMHDLEKAMFKDSDDYYSLLELGHKRWRASEDEIRKCFRKLSLKYHPDKVAHLGEDATAGADEHFKKIIKAHDVLSDRKKRAAYDSIDDVDDSIPSESLIDENSFYELLGPCFELNARWSTARRVPKLGGDDMGIDEVYKFYDFWYSFKTWRDFSFDLEYDVEQADSREERRWMERQNSKHIKARKLAESTRIRTLVDTAFNNDPRVAREKAREKASKEAAKEEKRRKRESALVAEREEKERKEREKKEQEVKQKEEKAKLKKEKELKRKVVRKARQRLRGIASSLELLAHEGIMISVERVCLEGSAEDIEICSDFLEKLRKDDATLIREVEAILATALKGIETGVKEHKTATVKADKNNNNNKETAAKDNSTSQPRSKDWSAAETVALQKALVRFPAGTVDRWIRIADQLEGRGPDEVRKVAHMMKSAPGKQTRKSPKARPESPVETARTKTNGVANGTSNTPTANGRSENVPSARKEDGPGSLKISDGPPNTMNFVKRQQMALEAGLKKFPAKLGESRWSKIAEKVPGRSPEECRARFLELAAFYKSKKASKK